MTWPPEQPQALADFYGAFKFRADGFPTAEWESAHLTTIAAPYPLVASWDSGVDITRIRCHRQIAESLRDILKGILAHYGSIQKVRDARMHLYGGVYNFRRISGSAKLSLHAYGAAIDLDPERNRLGKEWQPSRGMMPAAVVALFESAGWKWGGRFQRRKDCMHFQAST